MQVGLNEKSVNGKYWWEVNGNMWEHRATKAQIKPMLEIRKKKLFHVEITQTCQSTDHMTTTTMKKNITSTKILKGSEYSGKFT